MLTYTTRRNLAGKLTGDSSTANLATLDTLLNEADREIITMKPWGFRQRTVTRSTETGNSHDLPADCGKVNNITVTIGSYKYSPRRIISRQEWDKLNVVTTTSNTPQAYFVFADTYSFWPAPASVTANAITINYERTQKDLSVADYTTGTIVSIANGATTVTGNGTSWTPKMAGRYINITDSNTVNTGDGRWYEIASVTSATILELVAPYDGVSIAAGSANYTIGQASIIPEDFQMLSVYRASEVYHTFIQPEPERAKAAKVLYSENLKRMNNECGSLGM